MKKLGTGIWGRGRGKVGERFLDREQQGFEIGTCLACSWNSEGMKNKGGTRRKKSEG